MLVMQLSPLSEACGQMDLFPREGHYLSWLNKDLDIKANHLQRHCCLPHLQELVSLSGEGHMDRTVKSRKEFFCP